MFKKREPGEDVTKPKGEGVINKVLGALGHAFPKGIRMPDETVRNAHLYKPVRKNVQRPKTRLF